jgi:hypothetical protein
VKKSVEAFIVSTRQKLKTFRKNQLGPVTQITALAAPPMFFATGAAIDTVRISGCGYTPNNDSTQKVDTRAESIV